MVSYFFTILTDLDWQFIKPINAHSSQNQPDNFSEICKVKANLENIWRCYVDQKITNETTLLQIFGKSFWVPKLLPKTVL